MNLPGIVQFCSVIICSINESIVSHFVLPVCIMIDPVFRVTVSLGFFK